MRIMCIRFHDSLHNPKPPTLLMMDYLSVIPMIALDSAVVMPLLIRLSPICVKLFSFQYV